MKAPLPPMDLANMRANGVRHLTVTCVPCWRHVDVLADQWAADEPVPAMARRFRCSICGSKNVQTRPAWHLKVDATPPAPR